MLTFKNQLDNIQKITAELKSNPDVFEVAKYFVKIHTSVPKDGFMLDAKQAFLYFKEGERVNEEFLVKKHHYSKLTNKLMIIKVKNFDMFYSQAKFQLLTSAALSSVGTKSHNAPNIMTVLAE